MVIQGSKDPSKDKATFWARMEGGTVERAQALEMDTDTCLYLLEPPFSHLQNWNNTTCLTKVF